MFSGILVIARIMAGGLADKQGLLTVGDAIVEVNGVDVSFHADYEFDRAFERDRYEERFSPSL